MQCPKCGKEVNNDRNFCPGCGFSLNNRQSYENTSTALNRVGVNFSN